MINSLKRFWLATVDFAAGFASLVGDIVNNRSGYWPKDDTVNDWNHDTEEK